MWSKFEERIVPKQSFRFERLYLRQIIQGEQETIDNSMSRCQLQALKWDFKDEAEREDRMTEQLIAGTRHSEMQKKLLGKDKTLTLKEAIKLG